MDEETQIRVRVPNNLKKDFRILCFQQDKTMSDVLREFIEDYVEKNKDS